MDQEKIGLFIKQLREDKGWTQEELANKLFIVRETVSKWERGKRVPEIETLKQLAEVLNVSIEEILAGERSPKENITLELYKNHYKLKKQLKLAFTYMFLILLLFLGYYFINQYNSTSIYTLSAENENFMIDDSLLIKTREKIYFNLNNIHSLNGVDIDKIELYYNYDNEAKTIYSTNKTDIIILDYINNEEYFLWENFDDLKDNFYIRIFYDTSYEDIKLAFVKDYTNNNLFFNTSKNKKNDNEPNENTRNELNKDIENIMMSKFSNDNQDYYYYSKKNADYNLDFSYILSSSIINLTVSKNDNLIEEYIYYLNGDCLEYNDYEENSYSFKYENDIFTCLSGECKSNDEMVKKFLFFIDNLNSI